MAAPLIVARKPPHVAPKSLAVASRPNVARTERHAANLPVAKTEPNAARTERRAANNLTGNSGLPSNALREAFFIIRLQASL